jgi:hypothetical protein
VHPRFTRPTTLSAPPPIERRRRPLHLEVLVHSDLIAATRKLIREELVLLRRLALDRRSASSRMPSLWRTALLHRAAGGIDEARPADMHRRTGRAQ